MLSKIYHFGTKNSPYDAVPKDLNAWSLEYVNHCSEALQRSFPSTGEEVPHLGKISLPPVIGLGIDAPLGDVLHARKTSRVFLSKQPAINEISKILYYSLAFFPERTAEVDGIVPLDFRARRSSPSGGGLNCIDGYLYVNSCVGLKSGFYRYDPYAHELVHWREGYFDLGEMLAGQHFISNLPFGIFF